MQHTVSIHPRLPELITIRPSGVDYDQLLSQQRPQPGLGEVIVDVACGASILRGAHLYAPGVLAMRAHTKLDELVNIYADYDGGCLKGNSAQEYESEHKVWLGVGVVRMRRFELFGANLKPRWVNWNIGLE